MSRIFVRATPDLIKASTSPVSDVPVTMACWFNSSNADLNQDLVVIEKDSNSSPDVLALNASGGIGGDPVRAMTYVGGWVAATTTSGYSINTWHHGCAVFATSTDRRAFIDGGSKGLDTSPRALVPTIDSVTIGASKRGGVVGLGINGSVAEVGIWNVALTDAEVAVLGKGYSPLLVRPQSLVLYVPLIRDDDEDLIGGLSFVPTGGPSISTHPRIFYIAPPVLSHITLGEEPSASESASVSPSASASASLSPSASESASASASPSPEVVGEVTWGHETGVIEENVLTFADYWTGTGEIISSGDDEQICLDVGEYMESDIVDTGAELVTLFQNLYDPTGDNATLQYRHGATPAACVVAAWNTYTVPFTSLGYVQVRLEAS